MSRRTVMVTGAALLCCLMMSLGAAAQGSMTGTDGLPWWNDRVFYQVFVRSFFDSNGDLNGDFQGLTEKLDYLNDGDPATSTDLGVTGLWLMPVFEGPSYHGYHVTDFENVESDYGTNTDFQVLVAAAHARGMAVIIDMIANHTSTEHPWFQESMLPGSAKAQWYRWSTVNPGQIGPWGQQVWHERDGRYFYGVFDGFIPDLNLRNPAVTQAVYDYTQFWLKDMNVDGLRLDGARYFVEDGNKLASAPGNLTWLTRYTQFIHSVKPEAFSIGEVWTSTVEIKQYFPDALDAAFEFDLAGAILDAVKTGQTANLLSAQGRSLRTFPPGQYGVFLANHDQDRLLSQLNGNVDQAKVAAGLLLTNPGIPFLYYGEEIGMTGKRIRDDACRRTAFQWTAERVVTPYDVGQDCDTNETVANVASETDDPNSLLSTYRDLIRVREGSSALRVGSFERVASNAPGVYAFLRHSAEESVLVVINLSNRPESDYALGAEESSLNGRYTTESVYGPTAAGSVEIGTNGAFEAFKPLTTLPAYSTTILRLNPA